jgi:hypothetical protein
MLSHVKPDDHELNLQRLLSALGTSWWFFIFLIFMFLRLDVK